MGKQGYVILKFLNMSSIYIIYLYVPNLDQFIEIEIMNTG